MTREDSAPALEFHQVSLSFGDKQVLKDASFSLKHGQLVCITGASGSGKSVVLHLAIGLITPDSGEIFVEDHEIEKLAEEELLAIRGRLMGIVFQEDALFTSLSVYENVAFRPLEHGWSEQDADRAVYEVLRFVGLDSELDKLPEELSGGMRRRLEIARALVGWPQVMLYDEPNEGLDPINGEQVLDLILNARDIHRISSLLVTKNIDDIAYLASHRAVIGLNNQVQITEGRAADMAVIVLDKGEIVFNGSPEEFSESDLPAVVYMTHASAPTERAHFVTNDPWSKRRKPKTPF
jgi:phospholipid/cholesterol/gamma-HCH transport system ATP-binding protein